MEAMESMWNRRWRPEALPPLRDSLNRMCRRIPRT
jgi:hypothetical protein